VKPIPERRPPEKEEPPAPAPADAAEAAGARPARTTTVPVWRCKVCGYLCARDKPPGVCPICKAGRERFEPFPL